MRKNEDNVIQIGFWSDVDGFVKEIRQKLSDVKNWGFEDSFKDEIERIDKMLSNLSKSFSDGMNSKLDTKSFAEFEKKITEDVNKVSGRVDNLEDTLNGLILTFNSVDSGKFRTYLSSIGSDMGSLQTKIEVTINAVKELRDIVDKSNGKIQLADNSEVASLDKEIADLKEIQKLRKDIDKITDDKSIGSTRIAKNFLDAKKQVSMLSSEINKAQKELSDFVASGGEGEKLTSLQKRLAVLTEQIASLFEHAGRYYEGNVDQIFTSQIEEIMYKAEGDVRSFEKDVEVRLSDLKRIKNSLGDPSAISMDKEKTTLTIPLGISTTNKRLTNEAIKIINKTQKELKKYPLKIDFVLTSKYSSKKTNALLSEWQKQIDNIEDEELKEKFKGLYETIAKDFQKEIKINVKPDVEDAEQKVTDAIAKIKNTAQEKIHLKFDIEESDLTQLQKNLNKITAKLKLNVSDISFGDIGKSVEEATSSFQKLFGIFSTGDLDSMFEKMRTSVAGINGSLRGGDNNNLVLQLKEVLALYKQYKEMGGANALSDLGGAKNVQSWLSKHADDEIKATNPFIAEGKNLADGYAEGIRSGISEVIKASEELVEAALETIRKAQDSNSPSKKAIPLGRDLAEGYVEGFKETIGELKQIVSKMTEDAIEGDKKKSNAIQSKAVISAEEVKTVLENIAKAFVNDGLGKEVPSPVSKKNWSSLNRARKNPNRDDKETAENIQNFVGMYMKTGQTEMLSVIKEYIESSNLKDTLKQSLQRTFKEAIDNAEKSVQKGKEKNPATKTVVMSRKDYKDYLKKNAIWKDSEFFNQNFRLQTEAMQKDGRAFRTKTKSGRWTAWQYKVEIPINQIKKDLDTVSQEVENTDKKISAQKKGTKAFKEEANAVNDLAKKTKKSGSKKLADEYEKASEAATKQADVEEKATKKITKNVQEKIERYKELKEKLESIQQEMVGMDKRTKAYKSKANAARQVELSMNALVERARKNNKVDLKELVGDTQTLIPKGESKEIEKASKAIEKEGKSASAAKKKKEDFARANEKVAKASKKTADATKSAADAIEEEEKKANRSRESVLQYEQKTRRTNDKKSEKESEQVLREMQRINRANAAIKTDMLNSILDELKTDRFNKNFIEPFQDQINSLRERVKNLLSFDDVDYDSIKKLQVELERLKDSVSDKDIAKTLTKAKDTAVTNLIKKISNFLKQNSAMSQKYQDELVGFFKILNSTGGVTVDTLEKIAARFNLIDAEISAIDRKGLSFGDTFFKMLKSANAQFLATYFSFQDLVRYLREGLQVVVEVDSALTELRKVSDATDKRLSQSFKESAKTAKELGDTISNVIGVTADWARLGYSVDNAEKLAKVTTLFRTVGDNMTSEDSSSYLISTLKGFGKAADEAEDIVDVYNEVANNWAIDTAGIGEALQRSAASFYAANTDLEKSVALITATNTVVQDPASVGTLWKTLSARIRGAKTELQELDEEEDEFTETTSKLRDLVMGLTGFDILESDMKTFKDIYEIILGIGEKWQDLSDIEQASLAEALAGKRNSNALLAVLNNLDTLQGAYKSALEAEGSARKEQENYARSVQYSIDVLKASAQEFWTTLINSGTAKLVIDFLTKVVELLTEITRITHGSIAFTGGILLVLFGKDPERFVSNFMKLLDALGKKYKFLTVEMNALGEVTKRTVDVFQALKLSIKAFIAVLVIVAAIKAWQHFNVTVEETQEKIEEITAKSKELKNEISELEGIGTMTDAQKKRLSYLKDELLIQEKLLEVEKKRKAAESVTSESDSWIKKLTDSFDEDNFTSYLDNYMEMYHEIDDATEILALNAEDPFEKYEDTFKPAIYFDKNSKEYKRLTEECKNYSDQLDNLIEGSDEYIDVSKKFSKAQSERESYEQVLTSDYTTQIEEYYKLLQKLKELEEIRDGLGENSYLRQTYDKEIERYKWQIKQLKSHLIKESGLLGYDTSEFTIDERLGAANSRIARGNEQQLVILNEKTKDLSLTEKETWIIATEGATSAAEAIKMNEEYLVQLQEKANEGVDLNFNQEKFSKQVNELDALQSAYKSFVENVENNEPRINLDISDVDAMRESFGKLKEFDEFELVVTSDTSGAQEIQNAFDKLLTSYVTQKINLDKITEKNKDMIRTQLEMEGVTHESAQAYVDALLKMAEAQDLLAAKGTTLDQVTKSQIVAMLKLGEITPEVARQLALLALQEQLINNTSIDTTASISALKNLGEQAGFTAAQLKVLDRIMELITSANAAEGKAGGGSTAATEMRKAASNMLGNFQGLVQEELKNFNPKLSFDYSGAAKDASKGGKEAGDAYVEAYEKELKKLEDLRDRGLISEKEYLNRLKPLIDKYFKDRAKYAEKYAEELKKYMDQMLSYYNSVISGVTTLLDKRINALQKNKETTIDALNKEKDAAQERYQAEIDGIQDELDALEDRQDALDDQQKALDEQIDALNEQIGGLDDEIDKYHDMIDAINEANDARQREINLQKAQYELERAQNQRTKLVYTGEVGQMRYERDESTVRDTQENVRQAKDQIAIAALEKKIDLLEKEKERIEEEIDAIEKQKDAIDKQKDALNEQSKDLQKQQEEVQKAMESSSKYYEKLIKKQEEFFDAQIAALEKTKTKWEELAEIDEISKAWGLVSDEMTSLGFTVEDVLNDVPGAFDAFKEQYIAVLQEMHKGDQGYLDGLKENASAIPTEYGKVTQSVTEAKGPIDNLSSSVSTASSNVSTLGTSASTASTSVNNLKTASQGIAENFEALNEVSSLENLNDALKLVEESLINIKTLIGGMGDPGTGSIYGAIGALNTLTLDNLKSAFEELAGAVGGVISALTGSIVGSSGGSTTLFKKYTTNTTAASMTGGGLISGIQAVKDKTDDVIGTSAEEDGANAIGSFRELLKAIENVVDQIGVDKEKKGTLLYSIGLISKVTQNEINGSGGAISAFNDLESKIGSVKNAANALLSVLNDISSVELPDPGSHMSSSGNQHGGSSGSWGKSKAQGDPNVKTNGRSLVGELGPEVVVRGDKYKVVGVNGPEFVNLKKGDIVLNSKDTEELFDKKDLHGKAFAEGSKFTPFDLSDSYKGLLDKVKTMDFPTMREIKSSIDNLTRTVQSEIQNVTTTRTKVTQNNTFNISGVTGEEVAEKINNTLVKTFSGMSLNAYQRSMA